MYKNKRTLLPLLAIILLLLQMMNPVLVYADGETPTDPPASEETPPPEEQTDPTEEAPTEEIPSVEEGEAVETPTAEDTTPTEEPSAEATPSPEGDETSETPSAEESGPTEEPTETEEAPASEPEGEPAPEAEPESESEADLSVAKALEQAPEGTEIVVVNEEGEIEPLVTEDAAEIVTEADPVWCPDTTPGPTPGANGCSPSFTTMTDMIAWLTTNDPDQAGTIWIEDGYDSASEGVAGLLLNGSSFTNLDNNSLTIQGGWDGISGSTAITGISTANGDYLNIINWSGDVTLNDIVVDGVADDGIVVITTGDINLENVTSSNNGFGAYLDNIGGTGSISLTGANTFDGNDDFGLVAVSSGNISANNVTASNNGDLGTLLGAAGNISLTGTNIFNGNGDIGLVALSNGDISLNNVTAYYNGDSGIYAEIHNAGTLTVQNSTLGSSLATGNGNDGLEAYTDGSVTINNVTAIGNADNGVKVYADYGDGDLTVSNSTFSQNGDEGLEGQTDTGEINITNVFANQNAQIGLLLETYEGDITLDNITANSNGYDGADLAAASGNINVFTGQFNGNDEFGLWLEAGFDGIGDGDITLNNVTANTNSLGGAVLQTEDGTINVSTSQFNGNGADAVPYCEGGPCEYYPPDGGIGLAAGVWGGTGQINLKNVQASNNYGDGAWLTGDDVVVRYSAFHNNGQGLAYLGGDDLWADGLYIEDLGGSSAYLECVRANNNAAHGIEIYTGDITLNGVKASGNGWEDTYFESDTLSIFDNPCKTLKNTPDTPWQIVPITGGENVGLNCTAYAGTILVLPNGDEIRLPCPTLGDATLSAVDEDNVPDSLPEENSYVSSFTAQVSKGGISLETLPALMAVSFIIPEDMLDADLAILYWNGDEWIEVAGAYKTADNRFEAYVDYTGTFALVSK